MAVENGIYPERIYQGSSGSYFVKSPENVSYIQLIGSILTQRNIGYIQLAMQFGVNVQKPLMKPII